MFEVIGMVALAVLGGMLGAIPVWLILTRPTKGPR